MSLYQSQNCHLLQTLIAALVMEFGAPGDAREAIDNMDQSEIFGRVIKVAAAKPQREGNEGLGSKTAIWEQEGWLNKHAVSEEDRLATQDVENNPAVRHDDHMQGLEGLDVAGPQLR